MQTKLKIEWKFFVLFGKEPRVGNNFEKIKDPHALLQLYNISQNALTSWASRVTDYLLQQTYILEWKFFIFNFCKDDTVSHKLVLSNKPTSSFILHDLSDLLSWGNVPPVTTHLIVFVVTLTCSQHSLEGPLSRGIFPH